VARLRNRETERTFQNMIIAISDSLSDLAMSDNGEDGEPQGEEVAERGKLTEDDEPG